MAQQGLRDGGGYSRGNVGGKSSNPSKSSSLASKSDKAHKREHFTNGGSSGSSGSHEIKVSRNPQAYSSAVSRFADSDREDRDGPSDRTHYIAMNLIGQQVRAILKDGTVYEGIFHNPIFDRGFGVVLHMARKKESSDSGVVQTPPIDQVTVQPQDLVMIDAPEVAFVEDSAEFKKQMMREGGFRTDTEISGRDFSERELVPWSAPIDEEGGLGGLEDDQGARNRWDQFEANERLFGVRTTYDERVYTTEIDRQRVTREVVEKAIRIEREIKLQTTSNIHLAEERGIVAPKDDTEDEEDKYSSVLREQKGPGPKFGASSQAQKGGAGGAYVVPAKRKGEAEAAAAAAAAEPRDGGNNKAREHEFRKLRQREQEIEREREREREKEKEREKARQRERERIDRERAAKGLAPSSPATGSRASSSSSPTSASAAALSSGLSRSTTSIANLADETHKAPPSPSLPSKLTNSPFRQRSFSMSNIGAAVDESGAANPDPEDPQYLEKLRVQKLLTEMRAQGIDPRAAAERLKEPFHSPIVGRPEQLKSLDLSPAVPRVPESVLQEFQQYKEQRKRSLSTTSPAVPTKQDMVNFSKEIEKKTSTPNSPALRARRGDHNHNPIMPSPLSPRHVLDATAAKLEKEGSSTSISTKPSGPSASSSTSSSAVPTPATAETPATTPATLATPVAESPASASAATSPRKESAPAASATPATTASSEAPAAGGDATTPDGQVPLSKIQLPSLKSKLNPFAKAFTPKRPGPAAAAAPPASAPNASSMAATLLSAAAAAGAGDKSAKPTVDVNIPVSSFFAQGMRRLQDNPEDPEQVAPVWPYGRVPYRQEEAGIPMEGYYAPVPNMSLPPQGRHMGYPPVPYVTSPPPQMGSAQPVMLFPPGQPVPRGFVPQGSIPGPAYYPGGPGGAGPYPPHLYSAPPSAVPTPAGGPMGHKGRMGPPYPGAPPPHGHGVVPPPHSPHAPPHSPQGTPPRGGQAATAPAGYPPNSPTAFGVVPPPDHGVVPPPHSPHAPTAAPHSPHAPRAGGGPHMVPGPGQGQPPLYTFPPGVPPPMVVPGPGMAPPPRGAGGYRGYGQQPPPQMAQQQQPQQGQQQQQQQRPDGGKSSTAAAVQAQPFHPRGGQGSAININAGAFYPGQQRGGGQPAARGGPQQQQDNKEQRFKVPNTDVLPHQ